MNDKNEQPVPVNPDPLLLPNKIQDVLREHAGGAFPVTTVSDLIWRINEMVLDVDFWKEECSRVVHERDNARAQIHNLNVEINTLNAAVMKLAAKGARQ